MGFSWDWADTMIKAGIQFSKTHKNHILPGDLNRIPKNLILESIVSYQENAFYYKAILWAALGSALAELSSLRSQLE